MNTHQQQLAKVQQMTNELNGSVITLRKETVHLRKELALKKDALAKVTADTERLKRELATKVAEYEALLRAPAPVRGALRAVHG